MSYTPKLVLTSGVEPESPGSQPSTLPLSYVSMVRWLIRTAAKLSNTGVPIGGDGSPSWTRTTIFAFKVLYPAVRRRGKALMQWSDLRDLNPRHLA